MILRYTILFFIGLCLAAPMSVQVANAQVITTKGGDKDLKLAQQFFNKGEYEKAMPIFKKKYEAQNSSSYYYRYYFKCLVALKDYETAAKLIKKQKKKQKNDPSLTVDMGYLYRQQEMIEKAEEEFDNAINGLSGNTSTIRTLANTFGQMEEHTYVIKTYEKGRKILKDPMAFSYEMANTYKKQGDYENMIGSYLNYIIVAPEKKQIVKNEFSKIISMEKYRDALESELYKRIQKEPNELLYPELLVWLFVQEKDFDSAFIQVTAIDKRLKENGMRVFDLSQSALIEEQFTAAIEGFTYVIDKGPSNPLYEKAKLSLVGAKMKKLQYENTYTNTELEILEQDFLTILDEFGRNPSTTGTMKNLSQLYAFYLHDLDKAIVILEEIIAMPGGGQQIKARSKLDLGDYYIIKGDIWESTLYYSQVDKEFKDGILGEEARFRNAKLSYYTGDFEWAQAQLGILKASTSELISNDAIELSVFIIDNMGMDTTTTALNMFANADLLIFQNKTDEALALMNKLETEFPGHALADDILFRRGTIEYKRRDYEKAAMYWEKVLAEFETDILADNAIFNLAELYERQLNQMDKAKDYYRSIMVDFPSSLYAVEARKRFRKLRGDQIN